MSIEKKPKKNLEPASSLDTTPDFADPLVEWAAIIARIVVGANPYLDISMTHILIMDGIAHGVDEDSAHDLGKEIARKARITIDRDSYGGPH